VAKTEKNIKWDNKAYEFACYFKGTNACHKTEKQVTTVELLAVETYCMSRIQVVKPCFKAVIIAHNISA